MACPTAEQERSEMSETLAVKRTPLATRHETLAVPADELEGMDVVMPDGARLGRVTRVYLDDISRRPKWGLVEIGVFKKRALFPLALATVEGDHLRVPFAHATAKHAPVGDPGPHLSHQDEARLFEHYQVPQVPTPAPPGWLQSAPSSAEAPARVVPAPGEVPAAGGVPAAGDAHLAGVPVTDPRVAGTPVTGASARRQSGGGPTPLPAARFQRLRVTVDRGVATVVVDRPPDNALDAATYQELYAVFSGVDALGEDVCAVVLGGAGQWFSAGDDAAELHRLDEAQLRQRMFLAREALAAIRSCPVPVVGAVGGPAVGAGLALAASCDYVLASAGGAFAVAKDTVLATEGAAHLMRLLPPPIARWMVLTGGQVDARTMASFGGVVRVVPQPALAEAVGEARQIAVSGPGAVREVKRRLHALEQVDARLAIEQEHAFVVEAIARQASEAPGLPGASGSQLPGGSGLPGSSGQPGGAGLA